MDFLQEKGNRQYLTFLLGLLIASLGGVLFFSYLELSTLREMLISHESTMVSVLLEEGVPKETIALACSKKSYPFSPLSHIIRSFAISL